MYVFIATIFIAELIIAGFILSIILKLDKKVNQFCYSVSNTGDIIIKTVKKCHSILVNIQNIIGNSMMFLIKKKHAFRNKLINLGIIFLILAVFKIKFKRAAAFLQVMLLLSEYWNKIPV